MAQKVFTIVNMNSYPPPAEDKAKFNSFDLIIISGMFDIVA
jgi:hypothetical protein